MSLYLDYADPWVDEDAVPGERMPMLACRYCDCCWPAGGTEDHADDCLVPGVLGLERERDAAREDAASARQRYDAIAQAMQPALIMLEHFEAWNRWDGEPGRSKRDADRHWGWFLELTAPVLEKLRALQKRKESGRA